MLIVVMSLLCMPCRAPGSR